MAKIHLMQYLCPSRHAILATCYDVGKHTPAEAEASARQAMQQLGLEAHCGICGSADLRFEHAPTTFTDLQSAVVGAIAGYLVLWSVYWAFKLATGREGMGYGDFKLLSALGAFLGWQMLPVIILLSSLVGAVVGIALIVLRSHGRDVPIPFGPYLAAAGVIALFFGATINRTYLGLM